MKMTELIAVILIEILCTRKLLDGGLVWFIRNIRAFSLIMRNLCNVFKCSRNFVRGREVTR